MSCGKMAVQRGYLGRGFVVISLETLETDF